MRITVQRTLWIAAFLALALALGLGALELWRYRSGTFTKTIEKVTGTATVGGPFSLVNEDGVRVTDQSFPHRYKLIVFGFTFCPDICPTELQNITEALDLLGPEAPKIQPLFITIDPERDTPAVIKEYIRNFHPSLHGLTGTPEEIAVAAKAFRVYYQKVATPNSGVYMMDHSTVIYFMDPQGQLLTHFGPKTPPKDMAETLKSYLKKGSSS